MQIPAARIYNLPTARMYSLVCSSNSAPGGGRTVPRTMSRTALREDPRNSIGNSDSPPGGTPELRSKLRPLYQVAHIRCQLSSRASPSRTSSCRNPDILSALRNYFVGGREESQIMQWHLLRVQVRTWIRDERPLSTSIYSKRQGVEYHLKNSKCPCFMSHIKG